MSNFMTAKAWAGYTKESSRTEWHKNGRMEPSTTLLEINPWSKVPHWLLQMS
jgi:hypothetical protein